MYDGQKIIETRNGSGTMVQQFIHGTQYTDELVLVRVKNKGDLYVHQAERDQGGSVKNWNVIALTDLGGKLVERYVYTPYGQVSVFQESGFGDREGDQDVDATDKGTPGTTCSGGAFVGACRVLDLDFDGDYDSADGTLFDSLESGVMVRPGGSATNLNQPFAHQGLLHDAELASYQNRARQYSPGLRRFAQKDPLVLVYTAGSGYQDGMNSYAYMRSNPCSHLDSTGLTAAGNVYGACTLVGSLPNPNGGGTCYWSCVKQSCQTLPSFWCSCTCQTPGCSPQTKTKITIRCGLQPCPYPPLEDLADPECNP